MRPLRVALGFALTASLASAQGCKDQRSVVDERPSLPARYEVKLSGVSYLKRDRRGPVASASTGEVALSPSSGDSEFSHIEVVDQRPHSVGGRLVAGAGAANLLVGRLRLYDGVRVVDARGNTLDAPSAAYDPDSHELAGAGPAILKGPNYALRSAGGYVVDVEKGEVDLLGPVSGYAEKIEGDSDPIKP